MGGHRGTHPLRGPRGGREPPAARVQPDRGLGELPRVRAERGPAGPELPPLRVAVDRRGDRAGRCAPADSGGLGPAGGAARRGLWRRRHDRGRVPAPGGRAPPRGWPS